MIAIRVRPAGALLAGLASWEGEDEERVVPVLPARPAYDREDAERDGYLAGSTDAEQEIAFLKRLRRERMFRSASEADWRELLRVTARFAVYAELEDWAQPPEPSRAAERGVPIDVAEWLVEQGYAEPIEPDLEGLEAEVGSWAAEG